MERYKHDYGHFVGKAFLCSDGLVRLISSLSTRGYFDCWWREQNSDIWHKGAKVKCNTWFDLNEVTAPKEGESFKFVGATGITQEIVY